MNASVNRGEMKKQTHTQKAFDTIITTHMNADFDAMASMLAAQKLYPGSRVVFPGSQEKNLRNFFINSMAYLFNMADLKDIDFARIKRLVLVDTRQPSRIGKFSELLKTPGIDVHIYDHHPPMKNDIKGSHEVVRPTGSTIAILTSILEEKQVDISSEEATIMCLGLYEDTGSFTFNSTTEEDFMAAARLLSKGANLNVVSDLTSREISPRQLEMLNEMFQSTTHYNINSVEVVVTSITTPGYVPDFAFLVHKMIKMENINAIFALAFMGSKIYVVGRSRIPEVDAADIISIFGGGGHRYAAAATVKGKTLAQTEHLLVKVLHDKVKPRRFAKDLMSSPAISVDAKVACLEAKDLLTRYNINALLVTEPRAGQNPLVGFISRQIIEKAIFHQLGSVPVRDFMTPELASVGPEADLLEVQNKIIEPKQRLLPVVDKNRMLGVITRTDLLHALVRETQNQRGRFPDPLKEIITARKRNVNKFIKERLSAKLIQTLKTIGEVADSMGVNVYVIGGFVRDLFLYRPNEDIDIVIEGNGIIFAKKVAGLFDARVHTYAKFETAVIIFPDGFKIDVASARLEYYRFPAALPIVEMGSIKLDMFRRDFTINTLCIQLNKDRFGTLIDFFSAQKDLKEKVIRVLHNLSFVEDPTRIFRAIRFEQRFGFSIGKLTSGLIDNAKRMDFFKRLSGRRVFSELRQILEEDNPTRAIVRLNDYNLLEVIHPTIALTKDLISEFNSVKKVLSWYDLLFLDEPFMRWAVYFLALSRESDPDTAVAICTTFEIPPRHLGLFCKDRFTAKKCLISLERRIPKKNSTLYKNLSGFKTELILYMMAATPQEKVKKAISHYFTRLRKITADIQGQDLKDMRVKPGPVYKEILDAVLVAKLDGRADSRKEQLAYARSQLYRDRPMHKKS